jgi:O-antigen/teichoic acid export membrane protein
MSGPESGARVSVVADEVAPPITRPTRGVLAPLRGVSALVRGILKSLPEGTVPVGMGLIVSGGAVYGFLGITARALGPEHYTPLSVLWSLVFLLGPGMFLTLEQEVGRTFAGDDSENSHSGSIFRRGAAIGGLLSLVSLILIASFSSFLLAHLFNGEVLLLIGLGLALPCFAAMHLMRGALAGQGRFRAYALLIGAEGAFRLAAAALMASLGVDSAGSYGILIGLAPLVAVGLIFLVARPSIPSTGETMPWARLTESLGYLLVGSLISQALINAGPLAVQLLATDDQAAAAGKLLAGIVLTRIPLYLFQAVQAALLPKLAALGAVGDLAAFSRGMARLLLVVAGVTVVGVAAAFAVGPLVLSFLFGPGFELGRLDLALLALSSCLMMAAQSFGQALVALRRHARAALGWLVGAVFFVVVTLLGDELLARVEFGLIAGAAASTVVLGGTLLTSVMGNRRLNRSFA